MKVFIVVVGLVVALILAAWGWFGGFNRVRFAVREAGGETVVTERVLGDYAQSPAVMKRVYAWLLADGIATTRGIGIYYDKPGDGSSNDGSVPRAEMRRPEPAEGRCRELVEWRSDVGCIIDPTTDSLGVDLSTLAVLSARYDAEDSPDADAGAGGLEQGGASTLRLWTLPEGRFVVCEFPWHGGLSALVGVLKVYPALERFCAANDIPTDTPVTEIYDIPRRKIVYRREI